MRLVPEDSAICVCRNGVEVCCLSDPVQVWQWELGTEANKPSTICHHIESNSVLKHLFEAQGKCSCEQTWVLTAAGTDSWCWIDPGWTRGAHQSWWCPLGPAGSLVVMGSAVGRFLWDGRNKQVRCCWKERDGAKQLEAALTWKDSNTKTVPSVA